MTYTRENLPKLSVKLTITIDIDELDDHIENAAKAAAKDFAVAGFRKGHAPLEMVKEKIGEMKLLEAALEPAVRKSLVEAITTEKLETVGAPDIRVEKSAPGNPLIYTATLALMPTVEKLADYSKIKVEAKSNEVPESKIEDAIKELRRMQAKEVRVERGVTEKDKAVVDFAMKREHVPIEGGQAKDHTIYMEENHYIPGFKEQILGLKEGEKKNFTLKFPDNHYQKQIAGAEIEYDLTMKGVFEMTLPEFNDEFAKSLGAENAAKVRETIFGNMKEETEEENRRATEVEMLEKLADQSVFSEIPELLVKSEGEAMFHELEHSIEDRGITFADYLRDLKKTPNDLMKDFEPQALRRVKVALVLGKCSNELKTEVTEEELEVELDKISKEYEKPEMKERVHSPQFREHEKIVLRNRKTIEALKKLMVK
ncbi:MAG: trigger factor [bacterium]